MYRRSAVWWLVIGVLAWGCYGQTARAEMVTGDTANSTENLGNFSSIWTYAAAGDGLSATLTVSMTNSTVEVPGVLEGGYITAVAFNNPSNLITGVSSFSSTPNTSFGVIGGTSYNNSIGGSPFGDFDIGASITGDWLGGGSPTSGLAPGDSTVLTFNFTGSMLNTLSFSSFANELSTGGGEGAYFTAVRFRGFTKPNDGSDKVPGEEDMGGNVMLPVPTPSTLAGLLGMGLIGLVVCARRRRQPCC